MSEVAAVSNNLAGLHEYRLKIIAETANGILDFIIKHQPVKYIEIAEGGNFSRRSLRKHLDKLESKGKIVKIDSYYYAQPLNNELLNLHIRQKIMLEFRISEAKRIEQLMKKREEYSCTQPLRYALAMVKTTTPFNIREFFHHFKLYSQIEKSRFKKFKDYDEVGFLSRNFKGNDGNLDHNKMIDWYKPGCGKANNPLGINPDFLKLDGSIDYDKIERVYHNRREIGSWHMKCSSCGNEESVYVADEMNAMMEKGIRRPWHYKCSSCGKISHVDILGELYEMFERLEKGEEIELECNFQ